MSREFSRTLFPVDLPPGELRVPEGFRVTAIGAPRKGEFSVSTSSWDTTYAYQHAKDHPVTGLRYLLVRDDGTDDPPEEPRPVADSPEWLRGPRLVPPGGVDVE